MEKQKILIADDSEMNRALLVDILEDQYDIVEADNGAAAIDLLTQCGGDFSLLLLDIMMPEMDGFEVLAYINRYHLNDTLAVIMISADDSPANIKRAYDLGAFDYISRPFDAAVAAAINADPDNWTVCFCMPGSATLKISSPNNFTSRRKTTTS